MKPLLLFITYTLKSAFHLNQLVEPPLPGADPANVLASGALKRKKIVERLSQGLDRVKKRKFPLSKLNSSFGEYTRPEIETQVNILKSHAVVDKPTNRSVALARSFSITAREYLKKECNFLDTEITELKERNGNLTD